MHVAPQPGPLFDFIVEHGRLTATEAYASLNMGAGYAVYVPQDQVEDVVAAAARNGLEAWDAGRVEEGPRQVVIEPCGVTYVG
jgi:phosphoribosylformylglycinamidine cyclo-ligase